MEYVHGKVALSLQWYVILVNVCTDNVRILPLPLIFVFNLHTRWIVGFITNSESGNSWSTNENVIHSFNSYLYSIYEQHDLLWGLQDQHTTHTNRNTLWVTSYGSLFHITNQIIVHVFGLWKETHNNTRHVNSNTERSFNQSRDWTQDVLIAIALTTAPPCYQASLFSFMGKWISKHYSLKLLKP